MAEVVLEKAGKTYPGGVRAVEGFDLRIADGEFVVLVGPSGCGKSTTLRMIAGLEEITEGSISIAGAVVNDVHARDRDIAMVFQNYALYPHMTVERNLSFGLMRRRVHRSRLRALLSSDYRTAMREESTSIDRRVSEAAEMLGITDLLDRQPRALSGGQRQRVALGLGKIGGRATASRLDFGCFWSFGSNVWVERVRGACVPRSVHRLGVGE